MTNQQKVVRNERIGLGHFLKAEYLNALLDGNLSLGHFSYYRYLEHDTAGRKDIDEGVLSKSSPENTRIFIGVEEVPGRPVPLSQRQEITGLLAGPVTFRVSDNEKCHLFSCSVFNVEEGKFDSRFAEDRDYLILFPRLREFLRRFDAAVVNAGLSGRRDFVNYTDECQNREADFVFFTKPTILSYQREFRLAVYNHAGRERLLLELGDIRDFVRVIDLKDMTEVH